MLQSYILDFYAPVVRLAVEVDGSQHAESAPDRRRDATLAAHGITTLRFWNREVLTRTSQVVAATREVVHFLSNTEASPPPPLRAGGGSRGTRRRELETAYRITFARDAR